jgi:hypothetical protein
MAPYDPQRSERPGEPGALLYVLAVGVAVMLAAAVAPPARAAGTASGAFQCNATRIPVRAAVSAWDPGKRELRVMLFKAPPPAEAVKFWTETEGRGGYPTEWEYHAKFTLTLKDVGAGATQASLDSFHLYVDCPTLQANLTGSGFTPRAAEKLRQGFPAFEATLGPGGRVRMSARGADKLELPTPTSVTWDVRVDAPIYAK